MLRFQNENFIHWANRRIGESARIKMKTTQFRSIKHDSWITYICYYKREKEKENWIWLKSIYAFLISQLISIDYWLLYIILVIIKYYYKMFAMFNIQCVKSTDMKCKICLLCTTKTVYSTHYTMQCELWAVKMDRCVIYDNLTCILRTKIK